MIKPTISFLLGVIMIFSQFVGLANIKPDANQPSASTMQKISVASDRNQIIYGEPSIEYKGIKYSVDENGVGINNGTKYSSTEETCASADNFNAVNGKLYYTVFENGTSSIRSMDVKSGGIKTLLSCGAEEIRNMYVVNGSYILYLTGGIVYKNNIGSTETERVSPMDDIRTFAPTSAGNSAWNTKPNGSGAGVNKDTIVSTDKNHTLYAIWILESVAPNIVDFNNLTKNITEAKSE